MSVNRESTVNRFPINSIEFTDIALNLLNLVRYHSFVSKIKDLNRALIFTLRSVHVLNSKVLSSGMHKHLKLSRSLEVSITKVLTFGDA
jgi:hypothetical protein